MSNQDLPAARYHGLATDKFLYFFLRLRKGEIRRRVQALRDRYPNDTPERLARRLVNAQAPLSPLGGALLHLPMLVPGIGQTLKMLGFVSGASAITRMHTYLVLEIALVYGRDIDDTARVPELAAVIAATGLAAASPLLIRTLEAHPLYALPAGALTPTATCRLIGKTAIRFYNSPQGREQTLASATSRATPAAR
jgi:hypothetical protein